MVYQVLRSQLFYLDTADRSPSPLSSPIFSFPNNLLNIEKGQKIRISFNEMTVPYNFFQTETFNNRFALQESIIRGGVVISSLKIVTLDTGNYSIETLINELVEVLNISSDLYRYQLSYDERRNEIIYVALPILFSDVVDEIKFIFNREFILVNLFVDVSESACELLGFPFDSIVTLIQPNIGINQLTIKSTIPINVSAGVDNLYIRIEQNCNNYGSDGINSYSYSNVLAKIPIAQPPFSKIYYYNIEDVGNFSTLISGNTLDNFNIRLENKRGTLISPRSDFSFTIRIEVIVDKNEIAIEQTLQDMLKILKMNFIKEHGKPNQPNKAKINENKNETKVYNSS